MILQFERCFSVLEINGQPSVFGGTPYLSMILNNYSIMDHSNVSRSDYSPLSLNFGAVYATS
jgi:hypothetical protein